MKNILFATISIAFLSCKNQVSLKQNNIVKRSAIEIVIIPGINYPDTSIIHFEKNMRYYRTGNMYIQTEGRYEVQDDTLLVHYSCREICNKDSCGIQKYILKSDGNLHLVSVREKNGNQLNLSENQVDKTLEFLN